MWVLRCEFGCLVGLGASSATTPMEDRHALFLSKVGLVANGYNGSVWRCIAFKNPPEGVGASCAISQVNCALS